MMSKQGNTTPCPASLRNHVECMREILVAPPNRGIPEEPSLLLPHVYIGGQSHAESLKILQKCGITHVLNCAGYKGPRPTPNASPYEGVGIDYLEFQAEDVEDYDITQHFAEAFKYLDNVKRKHGNALVHCALGINRSAAVCLAYIMHCEGKTLFDATRIIKKKRKVALTNKGFQVQLVKFAKSIGQLDDYAETEAMRIDRKQEEEVLTWRGRHARMPSDDQLSDPLYSHRDNGRFVGREHGHNSVSVFDDGPRSVYSSAHASRGQYSGGACVGESLYSREMKSRDSSRDSDPLSSMFHKILSADADRHRKEFKSDKQYGSYIF